MNAPLRLWLVCLGAAFILTAACWPVTSAAPEPLPAKPFGIEKRIPWNTSKVIGSPEPPPPYRVRRTFAELKIANPMGVVHEPGMQSLLLVHQTIPWIGPGRILRLPDDGKGAQPAVLLSIDRTIYGVAFHPEFRQNGYLYVGSNGPCTAEDKDIPGQRFKPEVAKTTRVSRYTVGRQPPFACDPRSEQVVIEWPSNGHNGGDLAFGRDGMLYISSGDGTSDSDTDLAGQDLTRLLAKVLRIDVDRPADGKHYGIPPDNPFLKTKGARPETWAYGFRNPWRLHIDPQSGDLWVGNNGQDLWEQVYLVQKGANYGWSLFEGSQPFYPQRQAGPTPISKPIVEHHHSEFRSLTGGVVYHGQLFPELQGTYIYGDWSTGKIWGVRHQQGKVTWHRELADTTLQITGFGLDSRGELLIVDYGGGLYRLERAPQEANPAQFPTLLSETGLFASVKDHRPAPGLIPYAVNAPLWSDGADKERFLAIPGDGVIDYTENRGWNFPEGTVLVKSFSLKLRANDPASARRLETRLLTRQQGEWVGYTYVWNDAQTEATLLPAAGKDQDFIIADPAAPNGKRTQRWHYPSRAECLVCHSRAANFVLGTSVLQMNRDHDFHGVRDNQLRTLEHLGLFRVNWLDHFREVKRGQRTLDDFLRQFPAARPTARVVQNDLGKLEDELRAKPRFTNELPRRPEQLPRLVDPLDARAELQQRARSYLHANCAQCHVTAGGGNAAIDLEFTTDWLKTKLLAVPPRHQHFDIPEPQLIKAGNPEHSVLYQRLQRRGPGQMPPLATSELDRDALQMLQAWIKELKPVAGK
ncbi:MAG: PQQ-dependent sugar dehydrogenase [Planctomycetia bacterium]|nr:PQQ-dependent sugar dehydrogenase [Planctomycetia bacterium]